MNKIQQISLMLPLAFLNEACAITDIDNNKIYSAPDNSLFSGQLDNFDIFKYLKISDDKLIAIWTDAIYRDTVLNDPKILFPNTNDKIILKAYELISNGEKNLVIPFIENIELLSKYDINKILNKEINNLVSEQLPIPIILKALTDKDFMTNLIDQPNKILEDFGYSNHDKLKINILVDTKDIRHIILPNSPLNINQLTYYKNNSRYLFKTDVVNEDDEPVIGHQDSDEPDCRKCHVDTTVFIECTSLPTCY